MILFVIVMIAVAAASQFEASTSSLASPSPQPSHPEKVDIIAADIRFVSVDLFIDTKDQPLAVYQLEFSATKDLVKIVGVEGSSHEAFRDAPHFDPLALQQERIILAAFNTAAAEKLPRGKTRIATIHLQVTGENDPVSQVKSSIIATIDGKPIEAALTAEIRRTQS